MIACPHSSSVLGEAEAEGAAARLCDAECEGDAEGRRSAAARPPRQRHRRPRLPELGARRALLTINFTFIPNSHSFS